MINVLLDLDQTLIASEYTDKFDKQKYKSAMQTLNYEIFDDAFIIFERPHLQEFLDFLFAHFNVSVWTAASRDYGLFIVKKFILTKPERRLDFFFYSYHTNLAMKETKKIKDLSMLWRIFKLGKYNNKNTFIIDDNEQVYEAQPDNTIRIREFNYESADARFDNELMRIKTVLKKFT